MGEGGGWQLLPTEFGKLCVPPKKSWLRPEKQCFSSDFIVMRNSAILFRQAAIVQSSRLRSGARAAEPEACYWEMKE